MKDYLKELKEIEALAKEQGFKAGDFIEEGGRAPRLSLWLPIAQVLAFPSICLDTFKKAEARPANSTAPRGFVPLFEVIKAEEWEAEDGFTLYQYTHGEEGEAPHLLEMPLFAYIGGTGKKAATFAQWRELLAFYLSVELKTDLTAKELARKITEDNFNAFAFLLDLGHGLPIEAPKDLVIKEGETLEQFLKAKASTLDHLKKSLERPLTDPKANNTAGERLLEEMRKGIITLADKDPDTAAQFEEGLAIAIERAQRLADDIGEIEEGLERNAPLAIELKQAFNSLYGYKDEGLEQAQQEAKAKASPPVNFVANNVATALDRLHFNFTETEADEDIDRAFTWLKRHTKRESKLRRAKNNRRKVCQRLDEIGTAFLSEAEQLEREKLQARLKELDTEIEGLGGQAMRELSQGLLINGFAVYRCANSLNTYMNEAGEVETEIIAGKDYITRISLPPEFALRESQGFAAGRGLKGLVRVIEQVGLAKARKTRSATVFFSNAEIAEIVLGKERAKKAKEQELKDAKQDFKYYAAVLHKRDIKSAKLDTTTKDGIRKISADIYGVEVPSISSDYTGVYLTFNADLFKWAVLGSSYFNADTEGAEIDSPIGRAAYNGIRRLENISAYITGNYPLDTLAEITPELTAPKNYKGKNPQRDIIDPMLAVYGSIPAELMAVVELPKNKNGQAKLITKAGAKKKAEQEAQREKKKKPTS